MLVSSVGPDSAVAGAAILALAALYTDGSRRQIPPWILVGMMLLWVAAAWFTAEPSPTVIWAAIVCGAVALAVGYLFFRAGWLGGGDGKLLGVLALWLGPKDVGLWLLATAVLGLLLVALALVRPGGDFRTRGIPFAWAMVPPASALLFSRAFVPGSG